MEEKSRYEEMYGKLVAYEQNIHLQNQKRIKIGLKCIAIIPPIFLILLFWTDSNKVVFLILWIVSLFALATYLILVEYVDYNLAAFVDRDSWYQPRPIMAMGWAGIRVLNNDYEMTPYSSGEMAFLKLKPDRHF